MPRMYERYFDFNNRFKNPPKEFKFVTDTRIPHCSSKLRGTSILLVTHQSQSSYNGVLKPLLEANLMDLRSPLPPTPSLFISRLIFISTPKPLLWKVNKVFLSSLFNHLPSNILQGDVIRNTFDQFCDSIPPSLSSKPIQAYGIYKKEGGVFFIFIFFVQFRNLPTRKCSQ